MHTVDRGPEPSSLASVRRRYTPGWVRYYTYGQGKKPSDSKWRDFHANISGMFFGLCGYCERPDKGEVDHFRPKSKFPKSVYEWDNWIFACHACNQEKTSDWPTVGYVDPCAKSRTARAESYFAFDTKTGEILAKPRLTSGRQRKAQRMIDDLGLNALHHRKERAHWLELVSIAMNAVDTAKNAELISFVASRERPLSSITRAWLQEHGYAYGD